MPAHAALPASGAQRSVLVTGISGSMRDSQRVSVLFVCLGNICRSPTADAVLGRKVETLGLQSRLLVDSAGTGDWHVGQPPDPRSQHHAARRGYDLSPLRARQVAVEDFQRFDFILAMDRNNLVELERMRPRAHAGELGPVPALRQRLRAAWRSRIRTTAASRASRRCST